MSGRKTAALAVGAGLVLAACGSTVAVSAADPRATVAPGSLPVGISLAADTPVCTKAGDTQLCQIGVWYRNGTAEDAVIDARTTDFRDGAGQRHPGIAGLAAAEVEIAAQGKTKMLWSVKLPYGAVPAEVRWAAPDGSVTTFSFDTSTASPSASASATASESPSPTATPTPKLTSAKPTPKPTTATPTPKPTTATPRPRPSTPRATPAPTLPGGAIG